MAIPEKNQAQYTPIGTLASSSANFRSATKRMASSGMPTSRVPMNVNASSTPLAASRPSWRFGTRCRSCFALTKGLDHSATAMAAPYQRPRRMAIAATRPNATTRWCATKR